MNKSVYLVFIALAILSIAIPPASAGRLHKERVYQEKWCGQAGGTQEVTLKADQIEKSKWVTGLDDTPSQNRFRYSGRVDCLTAHYAIEFDFADKWAEAIGQALDRKSVV